MYYYLYHLKGGCILYFVYMLIYYVLNYNTNFSYSSQNGIEYLIGVCLVALLSQLTELLIYRVAYKFTGLLYYTATISGEHEGKTVHWFVRAFLMLLIFLFSLSPLPEMIISPLSHNIYLYFEEQVQLFSNSIVQSLQ